MKIDERRKRKIKRASAKEMKTLVERLKKNPPDWKNNGPRNPLEIGAADPLPPVYDTPVPKEKRENVNRLAAKLIDQLGVDTPEKLATSLFQLGPKAMTFSQA